MTESTTKVLLADDDALVRAGLKLIIESDDDLRVAAEASDGREAVELVRRYQPDVVLMDIRMPNMDGLEATRKIVALDAAPRVLVLTTFELDEYVFEALRSGASGFLLKRTPPEELVSGIKQVAAGEAMLSPSVTRRLIEEFASHGGLRVQPVDLPDPLTDREVEVLELLAKGRSNAELSEELFISEATVKTHLKHILAKLGVRDRVQAVVYAYESGLVRPGG